MPRKTILPIVADALRKELEPQGFNVHVRTNDSEIIIADRNREVQFGRRNWTITVRSQ